MPVPPFLVCCKQTQPATEPQVTSTRARGLREQAPRTGYLQQQALILPQCWTLHSDIGCGRDWLLLEALRHHPSQAPLSIQEILGLPWLSAASPQSLALSSRGLLPTVCASRSPSSYKDGSPGT